MLEADYLGGGRAGGLEDQRFKELNEYAAELSRSLVIPRLTREVNTAKRYAQLRQVYYSLILAQWFKHKFYGKGGYYSWLINRKELSGLTSSRSWSAGEYFDAYRKSFANGEFNIQERVYSVYGQSLRSYLSGGISSRHYFLRLQREYQDYRELPPATGVFPSITLFWLKSTPAICSGKSGSAARKLPGNPAHPAFARGQERGSGRIRNAN
jgi:hypothetical protein